MKPEDLAELSSEALLIVRYGRVAYANNAAQALFAACGRADALVGQRPEALWEEGSDPVCDATGVRRVRTRGTPVPQALEIRAGAAQPGDESGAFGVRVTRADTDPGAVHLQALLDAVIHEAPVAIEVVDPERMEYVDINEAAARLFGMARQDVLARGLRAMPTTAVEWLRKECARLIAQSPTPSTNTHELRQGGGSVSVVESTRSAVRVEGRWLIIALSRDVTDERAEHQRLQRLEAAINEAGDAISVVDPQRLEYLEINEGYARITGLTCEEIRAIGPVGILLRTTSRNDATLLHEGEASVRELKAHYNALIANYPEVTVEEVLFSGAGGREMRIESVRRAFRSYGRWLIIVVHRDITARYAASQHLQRLQAAMNQAADAIFVADPQRMEYLDANEAAGRLVGLSRQELLAEGPLGVAKRLSGRTESEVRAVYQQLIAARPDLPAEVRHHPTMGGRRVLEWSRRAVQVENRWLIISIARDVTERVRAQEELKLRMEDLARSNLDLEQFAYVTSHDLSEPLRMIASYTELLERRYSSLFDQEAREFMGYITEGAQRMRRLIVDLLSYSRAGRSVQMESLRLDEPLDQALANLSKAIADSGAKIERPSALPVLPCDRSAMMQLFQNLVGNALKFRGAQPLVVRIGAREQERGWTISVQDNGIGIEPKYFERIFVVFQRLHSRTAYEGTGIGLAICKRIVERHGGRISVESQPGQGTTFRFTLPLAQDAGSDEEGTVENREEP
jgi:PAS domain S-box-containing protein